MGDYQCGSKTVKGPRCKRMCDYSPFGTYCTYHSKKENRPKKKYIDPCTPKVGAWQGEGIGSIFVHGGGGRRGTNTFGHRR